MAAMASLLGQHSHASRLTQAPRGVRPAPPRALSGSRCLVWRRGGSVHSGAGPTVGLSSSHALTEEPPPSEHSLNGAHITHVPRIGVNGAHVGHDTHTSATPATTNGHHLSTHSESSSSNHNHHTSNASSVGGHHEAAADTQAVSCAHYGASNGHSFGSRNGNGAHASEHSEEHVSTSPSHHQHLANGIHLGHDRDTAASVQSHTPLQHPLDDHQAPGPEHEHQRHEHRSPHQQLQQPHPEQQSHEQPQPQPQPQQPQPQQPQQKQHVPGIPQPVLVLSLVSASLTLASCVFNTLLPIYMVSELRMSMRSMGMFEGALEAFSYIIRMFSGVVSDMMTSRKSAITLGFVMGAAAKFGMSGATEVTTLFASKALDRLANGVQAAPRDALLSDLAPAGSLSACFGFAQSLRKWGSAVGAVSVYGLMRASGNNYRLVFTLAATLSLASCVAFVLLVPHHKRPEHAPPPSSSSSPSSSEPSTASTSTPSAPTPQARPSVLSTISGLLKGAASMSPQFFRMQLLVCLYCMANINESLLEARAMEVGFGKAESTLVVAALAAGIFLVAYPLGRLDDEYGPRVTFAVGMVALIMANMVLLASTAQPWAVFGSLIFMAVHYGVVQGPLLSIVVSLAPAHMRGTAFGIFYTVMALTAVLNNSIVGSVWHAFGAPAAFGLSAGMTCLTLLTLPWLLPAGKLRSGGHSTVKGQGGKDEPPALPLPAAAAPAPA